MKISDQQRAQRALATRADTAQTRKQQAASRDFKSLLAGESGERRVEADTRQGAATDARQAGALDATTAESERAQDARQLDVRAEQRAAPDASTTTAATDRTPTREDAAGASPGEAGATSDPTRATRAGEASSPRDDALEASPDVAAQEVADPAATVQGAQTQAAEEPPGPAAAQTLRTINEALVKACYVGQDQRARKVVMLDVQIPGKGNVRVRLRRHGGGVEVRLRGDSPELSSLLRRHRGALQEGARARGVPLTRVDIA